MKIFFIGTVDFSRRMLESLLDIKGIEVVGIATKSKSKFNADHTDLSDLATKNGIPFKYVKDINAAHILDWINSLEPNVIFCFGWSSLIKKELLELSKIGVIGYHPTKLPFNRGRHPIIWALALGLEETASTFFKMDEGADSGDIVSQAIVQIDYGDTAQDLYDRLIITAQEQLQEFVPRLKNDTVDWQKQDDAKANSWRKRGKNDGVIDFRMGSKTIYNLVRALTKPYVGAHVEFNEEEYKVWSCKVGPRKPDNFEPGKILDVTNNNEILVKTGDGSIWLLEHEIKNIPKVNSYMI